MFMGLLNVGSLLLGIIAWILPVICLVKRRKENWAVFSIASISACAISLGLQILFTNHWVNISDWSALMDTHDFVTFVSVVLLVVTILLNFAVLIMCRKHHSKTSTN